MVISDILVEKGLLGREQLGEALALQKSEGLRLDRAIVQMGFMSERKLLEVMAEELHLSLADLTDISIDQQTLRSLPLKLVYRKRLVPISRQNGTVTVATSDPFDLYVFDEVKLLTGLNVQPVLAPREDMGRPDKRERRERIRRKGY